MSTRRLVIVIALFLASLSLPWSSRTDLSSTFTPGMVSSSCSPNADGSCTMITEVSPGFVWMNSNLVILLGRESGARFFLGPGIVGALYARRRNRRLSVGVFALGVVFLLVESGRDVIRSGSLAALMAMALLIDWHRWPSWFPGRSGRAVSAANAS